jgi:MFS family permease
VLKRVASIQFLISGAAMAIFTYVALYAREVGLSDLQITLMATMVAGAEFTCVYLFGRLADMKGKRKMLLIGLSTLFIFSGALSLAFNGTSLIVLRVLTGVGFGMFPAALAGYAFEAKVRMGRYSSFGSLGWGISTLIAGQIAYFYIKGAFILAAVFVLAAFIIALGLPRIPEVRVSVPLLPVRMILKNRKVLLPMLLRHSTASAIWVLWPLFLREELGLDLFQIGIVQAVNALTQFASMYILGDRVRPGTSLVLGLFLTAMAVLSFLLIRTFPLFLVTQVVLGMSWASLYVGALRSMMDRNPERSTASGLLSSTISFSALIGPLLSLIIVWLMPSSSFEAPMVLTVIASLGAVLLYLSLDGRRSKGGPADPLSVQ